MHDEQKHSKTVTVSMDWKMASIVDVLQRRVGCSRAGLVRHALLRLIHQTGFLAAIRAKDEEAFVDAVDRIKTIVHGTTCWDPDFTRSGKEIPEGEQNPTPKEADLGDEPTDFGEDPTELNGVEL